MPEKAYKVSPRNSTVNGSPGRDEDWSKFCWDGSEIYIDDCGHEGHPKEEIKAPLPFADGCLIGLNCQYIHVPYDLAEDAKIYRVRPNDSMWAGETYRWHLIIRQRAEKREDGWYWVLEYA